MVSLGFLYVAIYIVGTIFVTWDENHFAFYTQTHPSYWFSFYNIDALLAVLTYFGFFALNNKTAFIWILFYDSVFEISNYPIIRLNAIAVFLFMISILCFVFLKVQIKNKILIIGTFASIVLLTFFMNTASTILLGVWSAVLLYSQLEPKPQIAK